MIQYVVVQIGDLTAQTLQELGQQGFRGVDDRSLLILRREVSDTPQAIHAVPDDEESNGVPVADTPSASERTS
jgi:hypothetical protein